MKDPVHIVIVKNTLLPKDRNIRCPGNPEIDRPKCCHHNNPGKQIPYLAFHMDQPRADPCKHTCPKGNQKCQVWIDSPDNQSRRHSRSQRKAAIHRQIRKIQNLVCDIHSQRQDSVNQSLLYCCYYKVHLSASRYSFMMRKSHQSFLQPDLPVIHQW